MSAIYQVEFDVFNNQPLLDCINLAADNIVNEFKANPQDVYRPKPHDICIYKKQEGKIIGLLLFNVTFNGVVWIGQSWVHPLYRKHGYYKEMFDYLIKIAKQFCLDVIQCGISTNNEISLKVHEKLGMSILYEEDTAIYLTKELWR